MKRVIVKVSVIRVIRAVDDCQPDALLNYAQEAAANILNGVHLTDNVKITYEVVD